MNSIMHVTNLRFKFPKEESLIFRDLSFRVYEGEKVLLLGPSGSGKSTLLQVLSGIMPHSIDVPMTYDDIQLPKKWGIVFQDPDTQFAMPHVDEELAFVLENLNVPRDEMDARIDDALQLVGLSLEQKHVRISTLSQGMKQRLALASVLLLQPDVLFLDEPSALLDPEGTTQIWETVQRVAHDKTVVIVEHKIDEIAHWVDRIVLLDDQGAMIGEGPPHYIFETYEAQLQTYGIWYPEVWERYVQSEPYRQLMRQRQSEKRADTLLLSLQSFVGYRGTTPKITVDQWSIDSGEWIAIVGENGAGKSTLLLALMQLLKTTGTYDVLGERIDGEAKKREAPDALTLVFQNPELQFVMNTIYDELALAFKQRHVPRETIDDQVRTLLHDYNLTMNDERHPFQLSIGQKRRLSVATALSEEAAIILLDEPTFGQDAVNTFSILESLERLRQTGKTIVMVTHDDEIVKHFATRVVTIQNGHLLRDEEVTR